MGNQFIVIVRNVQSHRTQINFRQAVQLADLVFFASCVSLCKNIIMREASPVHTLYCLSSHMLNENAIVQMRFLTALI